MSARSVAIGLALCTAPLAARAQVDDLRQARDFFERGEYKQAAGIVDRLLESGRSLDDDSLVEAYRLSGLSHFYLGDQDKARAQLLNLLSTNPDYVLDPFSVAPQALTFFNAVRKENEGLLKPIREARQALRRKKEEDETRRVRELDAEFAPRLERHTRIHEFVLSFVPLGVGQFDQGRYAFGLAFAAAQVAGFGLALASYFQFKQIPTVNPNQYAPADLANARFWRAMNWGSFAFMFVSYGLSVAEALSRYEAQSITVVPAEAPAPPIKASVTPLPGGVSASVLFSF